ncbi:MAG: nucleotidyltransferase domain-containing protein [Deltaproteobacteria bacterium]|nr:nucleotidyltransferase domain-containing protein [Deltaproteobacteria bacterium]
MKDIIKKVLTKHKDRILFAYLFGSHVQGTASKSSDIDIAVFLKAYLGESFFDIKIDLYMNLSRALKRNDIDLVIMNKCSNIILLNRIITHGFVVYDQNKSERLNYEQKILHSAIDFKQQRQMAMGV